MFDKKDWQAALIPCGIQKGDNLIITGSLSYENNIIEGWPTLIEACLSMVGAEGTLITVVRSSRSEPIHADRTINEGLREKLIRQWSQSSYSTRISHPCELAFMMHDEVRKLVHPGYRFYAIGKYAAFILRKGTKHFPLHDDGPIQSAIKLKAKNLHFGEEEPWLVLSNTAQTIVVNGGIIHVDGVARWESFLDKISEDGLSPHKTWTILDEKVRLYEFMR